MAEFEILTECTAQIAVREKDCAGSPASPQAVLLPVVLKEAGNSCLFTDPADSALVLSPVRLTPTGTASALDESFESLIRAARKVTGFKEFEVGWVALSPDFFCHGCRLGPSRSIISVFRKIRGRTPQISPG
jgi:hypothetical protein